jgi:hypothetical protein
MHVAEYLGLVENAEKNLIKAFEKVSKQHAFEPDVVEMCEKFALWSTQHLEYISRFSPEFEKDDNDEPKDVSEALFSKPRMGSFGLLRDLHGLSVFVHETQLCWIVLLQAARALRHVEMETVCMECGTHFKKESMWLLTKIKIAAPQVLVVS